MRPNFNLDAGHPRDNRCRRRLEIQLQRLAQIGQRFLFGVPVTGDIDLRALRDEEIAVFPRPGCIGLGQGVTSLSLYLSSDVIALLCSAPTSPSPAECTTLCSRPKNSASILYRSLRIMFSFPMNKVKLLA
jgi:hypothetical protein